MNDEQEEKKRCEVCGRILDNFLICRCGVCHTAFYPEHPELCMECWDQYGSGYKDKVKEANHRRRFAYRGQSLIKIK